MRVLKDIELWYSCQRKSFSKDPALRTVFELTWQIFCLLFSSFGRVYC